MARSPRRLTQLALALTGLLSGSVLVAPISATAATQLRSEGSEGIIASDDLGWRDGPLGGKHILARNAWV